MTTMMAMREDNGSPSQMFCYRSMTVDIYSQETKRISHTQGYNIGQRQP